MNPADQIEQTIERLHITTRSETDKRILDDAFAALEKSTQKRPLVIKPSLWRIVVGSRITKLVAAAAVVILIISLFVTLSEPTSIYAQIVAALNDVQTLHIAVKTYHEGRWHEGPEIWYDRGVGLARFDYDSGKESVRIYNGTHMWQHSSGNDFAVWTNDIDPDYFVAELTTIAPSQDFFREPSGDDIIDDFLCRLYIWSNKDNTRRSRMWIDETNRIRQKDARYLSADGLWQTSYIAEFKYDIPVERSVFLTDFGTNVKIIDTEDLLEKQYSPKNAIFAKESLGLTFAVHDIEQCGDGSVFVVSSVRPTADSKEVVTQRDPHAYNYGKFSLNPGRYVAKARNSLPPIELAQLYHNGVEIKWYILLNRDSSIVQMGECELWVIMNNVGQLQRHRKAKDLKTWESMRPVVSIIKPGTRRAVDEIIEEVYSQAQMLEPILATVRLDLSREVVSDTTGLSRTGKLYKQRTIAPSEISLGEYTNEIMAEVNRLKKPPSEPEYIGTPEAGRGRTGRRR